jgi:chromosome segregation ATPase
MRAEAAEQRAESLSERLNAALSSSSQQRNATSDAEAEVKRLQMELAESSRRCEAALAEVATLSERCTAALKDANKSAAAIEAAKKAAADAQKAERLAAKQRDEAKLQVTQHEARNAGISQELADSQNEVKALEREAQSARKVAADREATVRELQSKAEQLQQRITDLESYKAMAATHQAEHAANAKQATEVDNLKSQADGMARAKAKLEASALELRLSLAEARSQAKSAADRVSLLSDERAELAGSLQVANAARKVAEDKIASIEGSAAAFQQDARRALEEARKSIRIMVTAPKVTINVGIDDEVAVHSVFPIDAIKDTVRKDVIPKFSKVMAVSDDMGDTEIRETVQDTVEELARTLQTKVHELMPAAEGTCNWDGFGSKSSTVRT